MRLIHTADWHLGNQMHGIDRREECAAFFAWLSAQLAEFRAEALVVSGDIFDSATPPVEARRQYYSFCASLAESCCRNVVIVGGNHDSASLLDSARELLEIAHVHVVGSVRDAAPEDLAFGLFDGSGALCGVCIALPFVREVELRALAPDGTADGELFGAAYGALYRRALAAAQELRGGRNVPIIATGHLYAAPLEGRLAGAASSARGDDGMRVLDVLGTLGAVPPSVFPPELDYVALGHVHYATTVGRNPRIWYSGSPFVLGFDEADSPRSVLCADVRPGVPPQVERRTVPAVADFRRIQGTLPEIRAVLEGRAGFVPGRKTFIELCYRREIGVNAQEFLDGAVDSLPPELSVVSWKVQDTERLLSGGFGELDAGEVQNVDDEAVFTQLILSRTGLAAGSKEAEQVLEKFLPLFLSLAGECGDADTEA